MKSTTPIEDNGVLVEKRNNLNPSLKYILLQVKRFHPQQIHDNEEPKHGDHTEGPLVFEGPLAQGTLT